MPTHSSSKLWLAPWLFSSLVLVGCSDQPEPKASAAKAPAAVVEAPADDAKPAPAAAQAEVAPPISAALPAVTEPSAEELTQAELQAVRDRLNRLSQQLDEPMTADQRRAALMEHLTLMQQHQQHMRQMVMDVACGEESAGRCLRVLQQAQIEQLHQFSHILRHFEHLQ